MSPGLAALRRRLPTSLQITIVSATITGLTGLSAILTAKALGDVPRGVIALGQLISTLAALGLALGLLQSARILLSDPAMGVGIGAYAKATRPLSLVHAVVVAILAVTLFPFLAQTRDPVVEGLLVVLCAAIFRAGLLREGLHGLGWHRATLGAEALGALAAFLGLVAGWRLGWLDLRTAMAVLAFGAVVHYATQVFLVARAKREARRLQTAGTAVTAATAVTAESARDLLRRMIAYSWPGLVAASGVMMASRMDRLILGAVHGPGPVGVYATASTLSDLAWSLPAALSPMIVRSVALSRDPHLHILWWRRILGATVALSVVVAALGWWLLERYLPASFHGSTPILLVLLLSSLIMASQQVDLAVCNGFGDLRSSARSALWGLGAGTVAYLVLIPPFGAIGCAWGNVVTFAAMALRARIAVTHRLKDAQ